jgi:hypothetical protein
MTRRSGRQGKFATIRIEEISDNILKIAPPEKLAIGDFPFDAPQVDAVIGQYGDMKLLIGAVRSFQHPEVKAFGARRQAEALEWLGSA